MALRLLGDVSTMVTDQRIAAAAASAARNASNSRMVRLAAIYALVGQFDSSLSVVFRTPTGADTAWDGSYVMFGRVADPSGRTGAEPLPPTARADILRVLQQLGASDGDDVVRRVSRYVARRLRESPARH
jgi:hypothetical protein